MTAANQQIVSAFEELHMSPEEISEDQGMDVALIKSVLAQFSSLYRKDVKNGIEDGFSDEELVRANNTIVELMQYAEDERLRFRAAAYIRDDKKGRLDAVKAMAGLNVNVMVMQEAMNKAMQAMKKAKRIVDVESESTKLLPA